MSCVSPLFLLLSKLLHHIQVLYPTKITKSWLTRPETCPPSVWRTVERKWLLQDLRLEEVQ